MRRGNLKKVGRAAIAFGLAGVMCIINPAHTLAASPEEEEGDYVSEVRISTAKTETEAQNWLYKNGYEVQEQNLNEGTGKDAVYLGYKTTSNPDKAITDMAVMNMKGGYSYGEYEDMVKRQKESVGKIVKIVKVALKEYRDNYAAGTIGAKKAHEVLNGMREDDSGKLVGDYLLDESLSEDDLVKVIMQGNTTAMTAIYQGLAVACSESGNDNWLKRLSAMGPNNKLSPEKYDDKAREIYNVQWEPLQEKLQFYKNSGIKVDAPKEKIEEWTKKNGEANYARWLESGTVYELLASYSYGKAKLVDYFLQKKENLKIKQLYPIVKAMTDGQYAISNLVGFSYLMQVSGTSKEDWKKANETSEEVMEHTFKEVTESKDIPKEVSLYAGVDRSLFDGGVALTNEALQKSVSKGDTSWFYGNISKGAEIALFAVAGTFFVLGVSLLVFNVYIHGIMMQIDAIIWWPALETFITNNPISYGIATWLTQHFSTRVAHYFFAYIGVIALGIMLITAAVYVSLEVYHYKHPKYTQIPRILVDEKKDEQGKQTYLNYYAVKDQKGEYADLNAWSAREWNALYTTKDRDAGNPITIDMICQNGRAGNVAEEGYSPVHAFGEEAAYNLNNYCFSDDLDGLYMFFVRDEGEEDFVGSTFGTGNVIWMAGLGGILIGGFVTALIGRRRRKKLAEA